MSFKYGKVTVGTIDDTTRACGTVVAAADSDGMFTQIMGGITAPFGGEADYVSSKYSMYTALGYGLIGALAGGYVGRGRATAGNPPLWGFVF